MKVAIQNVCAVVVRNLFVPTTTEIVNDATNKYGFAKLKLIKIYPLSQTSRARQQPFLILCSAKTGAFFRCTIINKTYKTIALLLHENFSIASQNPN
jgi:hypothetical protein